MDNWSDGFIPPELRNNIIRLDKPDNHEREGYTVGLAQENAKNPDMRMLHTLIDVVGSSSHASEQDLELTNPVQPCPTAGQRTTVFDIRPMANLH
ncbi:hypothetical protein N7491_011221 [Penicillium cf. griseofulvum]|uniref:Uncharacterized protein n=1 Tax=Penicillium cf. griseofulvum TaxID=2972120 RepID=A0A9W9N1G2_9EURO|nr:hypothetical protein N7472_001541 [Penicillium cf. griseofulvum]KAJ5422776.1 hypothetical protein N7491_011221 [Penicillium cf. griseofulvum]KAJ5428955.1 hypothetical protein N7445_010409 [Penicillium cf. griseofulvum]